MMQSNTLMAVALALWMSCAPALAAEGQQKKQRAKQPDTRTELLTMEQKVAESKAIFVGEGVRIYFVDRRYRETPYIRAEGEGALRWAILVVKPVKALHPPKADLPAQVLVPIMTTRDVFGEGRSHYDEQVNRHVGKQHIWFGESVVHRDYVIGAGQRKPLEDPVTVFQARTWQAKKGPTANPLPAKQLAEVEEAIARVRGGAKPPAPPARKDEG
jgi:hypothetical protein